MDVRSAHRKTDRHYRLYLECVDVCCCMCYRYPPGIYLSMKPSGVEIILVHTHSYDLTIVTTYFVCCYVMYAH